MEEPPPPPPTPIPTLPPPPTPTTPVDEMRFELAIAAAAAAAAAATIAAFDAGGGAIAAARWSPRFIDDAADVELAVVVAGIDDANADADCVVLMEDMTLVGPLDGCSCGIGP